MRKRNYVRNLDIPLVCAGRQGDNNEERTLERPLVLRITGIRLDITQEFHVG